MDITETDVTGLHAKLSALDLTDGERSLLGRILDAASEDEVAGFTTSDPFGSFFGVANRFVVSAPGLPRGFAESGKKAESL